MARWRMTKRPERAAPPPGLLDHVLGGGGAPRDAATANAFERVGTLLRDGRTRDALSMLEYAQRLAPQDGGITLAIGLVRLKLGDRRAAAPLEALTQRTDWRDLWLALARVRLRFGEVDRAAVDLHAALARNSPPTIAPDRALADRIAAEAGAPGWCGLDNAGRLTVRSARGLAVGLAVLVDGVQAESAEKRPVEGGLEIGLAPGWERARCIEVLLRGRALLGSPIDVARITRVEGFVAADAASGSLRGWCWFPAERERPPVVMLAALADAGRALAVAARSRDPALVSGDGFGLPWSFAVEPAAVAALGEAVRVTGPHGQALYGSPVWRDDPAAAMRAVARLYPAAGDAGAPAPGWMPRVLPMPVPAEPPPRPATEAAPRAVDIVVPVHAGRETTLACIESLRAHRMGRGRIIVMADACPDPALLAALHALAEKELIVLSVETVNRGFPATANAGLRLAEGHDAVLLNADTVVTPGWLDGLRAAAYAAPDIGTATPLSNDATIFSYPRPDRADPAFDMAEADRLAAIAAAANAGTVVDVPTGHGFCLYIRADCLAETGLLREDLFAQGYGEENDFCMRARHLGWRHVAAPGVFVAHHGTRSFNAARADLRRRNVETLNRLHLGYDALIADWQKRDPLRDSRRRMDEARLQQARAGRESVLLITHDRAGGVRRHVAGRVAAIRRDGRQALVLRPDNAKFADGSIAAHAVVLDDGAEGAYPNLRFRMPEDSDGLRACLEAQAVAAIEVQSLIGHAEGMLDLLLERAVPVDVAIHDHSWFCPRITLTTGDHRYCGEPDLAGCGDCVDAYGGALGEAIAPETVIARSQRLFAAARSVVAPSEDAALRIRRRFGATVSVQAWEPPPAPPPPLRGAAGPRVRVCMVGAIGHEKGYGPLLRCARRVAAAGLPLEFIIVGHTRDDRLLLDTGVVRITGRYEEDEAAALIAEQQADLGWLPSIWPETWCYALTRMWEAGLHVVVHDIGAQAERVRAGGGGFVVPLHMPSERMAGLFLDLAARAAIGGRKRA
jgi:GT2 family glycosyltransferase/glycosyltransferase involved in cell wall biosynthesis